MRWLAGLLAVALAGCGLNAPGSAAPTSSAPAAPTPTNNEVRPAKPPSERTSAGSPSAVAAVRAFATRYINWSADTVAADMRALAAQSVGQARSAMELAAAQTAQDYELQRGGIANSGTVEAVAPLARRRDQYVVVTREQTTATDTSAYQGLRPAWHVAVVAVVQQAPGEWVVSRWQPES